MLSDNICGNNFVPGIEYISELTKFWNNNSSGAKFKMGDVVEYSHKLKKGVSIVIGINVQDEFSVEYALKNVPFLLYEEQLNKI